MLCRAVAIELEVTKELNKLLYSVESVYLGIVREVAMYAVANNVTSVTQLHRLFYSKYRSEYPGLHAHLVIQAIRQASGVAKSFMERRRGLAQKHTLRLGASQLGSPSSHGAMTNSLNQ
jgi:hypothetical protein